MQNVLPGLFFPKSVSQQHEPPLEEGVYAEILSYLTDPADVVALKITCTEMNDAVRERELAEIYRKFTVPNAYNSKNFRYCEDNLKLGEIAVAAFEEFQQKLRDDFKTQNTVQKLAAYVSVLKAELWEESNAIRDSRPHTILVTAEQVVIAIKINLLNLEHVLAMDSAFPDTDERAEVMKNFLHDPTVKPELEKKGFSAMRLKFRNDTGYINQRFCFFSKHLQEYAAIEFASRKDLAWTLTMQRHKNDCEQLDTWFCSKFNFLVKKDLEEYQSYQKNQSDQSDYLTKLSGLVIMDFTPAPLPKYSTCPIM